MAKYRTTGCFKFLIFLIIAIPAAFLISSYYHGQNPLDFIQDKLGNNNTTVTSPSTNADYNSDEILELNTEINELRNEIRKLEDENKNLRAVISEKDKEIESLSEGY